MTKKTQGPQTPKRPAHRPSPWSAPASVSVDTRMPPHVSKAWRHFAFKQQVDALAKKFLKDLKSQELEP